MRFIFSYVKRDIWLVVLCVSMKIIASMGELLIPYGLEQMIDKIVPTKNKEMIVIMGVAMIILSILIRQLSIFANHGAAKVAQRSVYRIRRDLFWKTLQLSGKQVDQYGLPSLTSRMTSDSYNVQNFIQTVQAMGIRAPILMIGGIIVTLNMDVGLAAILCGIVPILIALIVWISFSGIPLYDKVQKCVDDIVRIMRENITGIRVVKALSKERYEINRFQYANEQMVKKDIKAGTVMALPGPVMTLFLNISLTLVIIIGARRVNNGDIYPGVILAFLTYFNMILMGVMGINRVFMMMSKANASAKRIAGVVNEINDLAKVPDKNAAKFDYERFKRDDYIVFDHVEFNYDVAQEQCLNDISFTVKKGGSLGIIGATGAGKTTIVNLLMRFYDVNKGAIFINGRDVRTYKKDELHQLFGVVFQNDVIFADTLYENIVFGRNATLEEVKMAASDAKADEFIEDYEDAYDHKAVIHGANLSGGQKQRTLIARALLGNPEILVLDDASSALDYKTDAGLRKTIRENHSETTTIIIAQRVSSIMNLDHIIVLDEGEMIGYGTHEELLEACEIYREIYKTQMGERESVC